MAVIIIIIAIAQDIQGNTQIPTMRPGARLSHEQPELVLRVYRRATKNLTPADGQPYKP